MGRIRLLVLTLALAGAAFVVVPVAAASAAQRTAFAALVTEEFCGPGVTCGTAVTPYGPATVRTVITGFTPLPSGCFLDHHTSTLTFADSSTLALAVVGTLCPTTPGNFRLTGTYSVAGGTGRFTGATGSGFVGAIRQNGPIHAGYAGTLTVAGHDD